MPLKNLRIFSPVKKSNQSTINCQTKSSILSAPKEQFFKVQNEMKREKELQLLKNKYPIIVPKNKLEEDLGKFESIQQNFSKY